MAKTVKSDTSKVSEETEVKPERKSLRPRRQPMEYSEDFKKHMDKETYSQCMKLLEENNIAEITQEVLSELIAKKQYQKRKVEEKLKGLGAANQTN